MSRFTLPAALLAISLCLPAPAQDKEKPLPKDIPSLKALAEKGDARAQTKLGQMYAKGEGVLEDDVEAVKWFRKAALQGGAAEIPPRRTLRRSSSSRPCGSRNQRVYETVMIASVEVVRPRELETVPGRIFAGHRSQVLGSLWRAS